MKPADPKKENHPTQKVEQKAVKYNPLAGKDDHRSIKGPKPPMPGC